MKSHVVSYLVIGAYITSKAFSYCKCQICQIPHNAHCDQTVNKFTLLLAHYRTFALLARYGHY